MKVLYVGNVLSEKIVEKYSLSIAGKKYELALLKSLDSFLGNDLTIVSRGRVVGKRFRYNDILFQKKICKILHKSTIPIFTDFILNLNLLFELSCWTISNIKGPKSIVLLNSPFGISFLAVIFKLIFRVKIFSLTIDSPFISENKYEGFFGLYTKTKFKLGHKLLNCFSGIAVLNMNVKSVLKLKIPILLTKIGYDTNKFAERTTYHKKSDRFTIVYVGTLMKFKGIDKLMEAIYQMNDDVFELIICGDGPLKDEVISLTEKYSNISYKGRVSNEDLRLILGNADLLVNFLQVKDITEDFGFPSKLIDYILSSRPVLTNIFTGLPEEFTHFLHLFEDDSVNGVKSAILNVYNKTEEQLQTKCKLGYDYIRENYTYQKISEGILTFINDTSI